MMYVLLVKHTSYKQDYETNKLDKHHTQEHKHDKFHIENTKQAFSAARNSLDYTLDASFWHLSGRTTNDSFQATAHHPRYFENMLSKHFFRANTLSSQRKTAHSLVLGSETEQRTTNTNAS